MPKRLSENKKCPRCKGTAFKIDEDLDSPKRLVFGIYECAGCNLMFDVFLTSKKIKIHDNEKNKIDCLEYFKTGHYVEKLVDHDRHYGLGKFIDA
uniref:Uncharacterized protein n=1 Tax=viral metagenome TaxID=1070528 RepID=A0A6H1ZMU8_9ZZZZ